MVFEFISQGEVVKINGLFEGYQATYLCQEILKGNLDGVKLLYEHGFDINMLSSNCTTPLLQAINVGRLDIVNFLLDKGACVNDTRLETPIFCAIKNNNFEMVDLLIQRGSFIQPYLNNAARTGNIELVKLFLERGANPNYVYRYKSPLTIAIETDNVNMVALLLQCGANLKFDPLTSLYPVTLHIGRSTINIIKLLCAYGEISSPIIQFQLSMLCDAEVLTILFEQCLGLIKVDFIPINCFIERDRVDLLEICLIYGYNIKQYLFNPLLFAVVHNCRQTVHFLINYDPKLINNSSEYNDNTPLEESVRILGKNIKTNTFLLDAIKIMYLGYNLDQRDLIFLQQKRLEDQLFNKFCETCELEAVKLKSKEIGRDRFISLHDILSRDLDQVIGFLRNDLVKQDLISLYYDCREFPIYCGMLRVRIKLCVSKRDFLDRGYQLVRAITNNVRELPDECTAKIFSYFEESDIRVLLRSFSTNN